MFNELVTFINQSIDLYIIILSRMIGIFFIAPIFSRNNIPAIIKVGLSMFLSYVMLPFVIVKTSLDLNGNEFFLVMLKEGFTGFCIGLCMVIIFDIFASAGAQADVNIGLSMAQIFDPSNNSQITISGQFFNTIATLIFLAINGHHLIIRALVNSFELLPINSINFYTDGFLNFIIELYKYSLVTSLLLVMPIILILFLGNLVLAFMSKVMPQMNVFIVGMPFKIIVGFIILYITLPGIKGIVINVFTKMIEFVYIFLRVT